MSLLRNYFWWTYDRGSLHYDVMVTAILLFLFVSPRFIDFKDKPAPALTFSASQVLVKSASGNTLTFEVRAADLHGASTDADLRTALLQAIQPIAGQDITLDHYTPVLDTRGHTVAYDAAITR